MKTKDTETVGR